MSSPIPHINLATVTYLFEGCITHRDSLGTVQDIEPGAINLMVAGKGIAHSERTPDALRASGMTAHGIQLWCALPESDEETDPCFFHYPAEEIPSVHFGTAEVRVMMGRAYGVESPVKTYGPTIYIDAQVTAGSHLSIPEAEELAVYAIGGSVTVDGEELPEGRLGLLESNTEELTTSSDIRCIFIGGKSLGQRYMWWNFVSSRNERILQAMEDWENSRFDPVVSDDDERAPIPPEDSYSFMKEQRP
jgi:redox-sensitive bicupin YhaK (pirin superfamily)